MKTLATIRDDPHAQRLRAIAIAKQRPFEATLRKLAHAIGMYPGGAWEGISHAVAMECVQAPIQEANAFFNPHSIPDDEAREYSLSIGRLHQYLRIASDYEYKLAHHHEHYYDYENYKHWKGRLAEYSEARAS